MGVVVVDHSKTFMERAKDAFSVALNKMAVDIERLSKEQVPHDKGQLKASGKHLKLSRLVFQVRYDKEYALFQHEGGDEKRRVRKYSKPGKKKHYLIDPANLIQGKAFEYFATEAERIRL